MFEAKMFALKMDKAIYLLIMRCSSEDCQYCRSKGEKKIDG